MYLKSAISIALECTANVDRFAADSIRSARARSARLIEPNGFAPRSKRRTPAARARRHNID
jgi:hypothetical protein